jgi:hypothetical protein
MGCKDHLVLERAFTVPGTLGPWLDSAGLPAVDDRAIGIGGQRCLAFLRHPSRLNSSLASVEDGTVGREK